MKNINTIKREAHYVRFSPLEKDALRTKLLLYARAHPISPRGMLSPLQRTTMRTRRAVGVLVGVGILVSSSVSFAAEAALPGDVLYPVKIYVNEPVRGGLSLTEESRALWEVSVVERRLKEIEQVSREEGESGVKKRALAEKSLERSAIRMESRITRLESRGKDDTALRVSRALNHTLSLHEEGVAGDGVAQEGEQSFSPNGVEKGPEKDFPIKENREDDLRGLRTLEHLKIRAEAREQAWKEGFPRGR